MADAARRKTTKRKTKPAEPGRRETILAAAVESVVEEGYVRTTMSQVARRAGVPRPLVQYYFPTLALLLRAAIEAIAEGWRSSYYKRILTAEANGAIGIAEGVEDRWVLMQQPLYRAYHELLGAARTDTELAAIMEELDGTHVARHREAAGRAFSSYVAADAKAYDDTSTFTSIFLDGLLLHQFGAGNRYAVTECQLALLTGMLAQYWSDHGLAAVADGAPNPTPQPSDLSDLAQQLIDRLRPLAETKPIT